MMSEYITMIENMDVSDLRQISETTFMTRLKENIQMMILINFSKESYNEKVLLNELNNLIHFIIFTKVNDQIAVFKT